MVYPIPSNSAAAWESYKGKTPQNPGLIFERFAPDWSAQSTLKKDGLEVVRQAAFKIDKALLTAWNARWEAGARSAHAEPFTLKTDWRFITGLGRKGPLEVGFTFHRYGFPILPGSSVKGLARAWGLLTIAEALHTGQLNSLDAALSEDDAQKYHGKLHIASWQESDLMRRFRLIFGTTGAAGLAVFWDAIPARVPVLQLDIMNPHYPKYYDGSEPPTDWQSPIPVYFLTVAPQTEFRFAVGWRRPIDEGLRDLAKQWLVDGLTYLGAGAKTSAGYGYFQSGGTEPTRPPSSAAPPTPVPTADIAPALPRKSGRGKVKYDHGRPIIVTEEGHKFFCDWKSLGMDALAGKTAVEFEYEEPVDGRPRVVKVRKI